MIHMMHMHIARQAARESVVLLQNRNGALPLHAPGRAANTGSNSSSNSSTGTNGIAVIGPNADVTLFGNYAGSNANASTILDGIRAAAPGVVKYAKGCDINSNDTSGLAAAVAAARSTSVTVACVGLSQVQMIIVIIID